MNLFSIQIICNKTIFKTENLIQPWDPPFIRVKVVFTHSSFKGDPINVFTAFSLTYQNPTETLTAKMGY